MDLKTLQRALGGEISNGQLLCRGPGHSPRDRSLAVKLAADGVGFIVHSHCGDDWRACDDYVRRALGWGPWQPGEGRDRSVSQRQAHRAEPEPDVDAGPRPRSEDDLLRIGRAVAIWKSAVTPRGTAVETYLRSRALELTDDVAGTVLRFHTTCPWRDENTGTTIFIPALIAAFRSIDDDAITGIHRIRLDQPARWPKTERRMFGVVHRAAVKLDPAGDTLAIGEGIETCLAARALGYRPAWALGSVGAISFFPLIDSIQRLQILGEAGAASARAVELCGRRWYRAGRKVRIVTPDDGHSDLNDELMAARS